MEEAEQRAIGIAVSLVESCLTELNTPAFLRNWHSAYEGCRRLEGNQWLVSFVLKEGTRAKARVECTICLDEWEGALKDQCRIALSADPTRVWEYRYAQEAGVSILRSRITLNQMDYFQKRVLAAMWKLCLGGRELPGANISERLRYQGCEPTAAGFLQWLGRNYNAEFACTQEGEDWHLLVLQGELRYPPITIMEDNLKNLLTVSEFEAEFGHRGRTEAA